MRQQQSEGCCGSSGLGRLRHLRRLAKTWALEAQKMGPGAKNLHEVALLF
jgi:hypothetical protein